MSAVPQVLLAEAEDGGFAVIVCPTQDIGHDQVFATYIGARTHARRLRFAFGWKLVDRVDAKTRRAAEEAEERRVEARRATLSIRG